MSKQNSLTALNETDQITCERLVVNSTLTPKELFKPFSSQAWAMWLDSCTSEHIDSRYDIFVWSPSVTLTTKNETTKITHCDTNTVTNSSEDPLTLIKDQLKKTFNNVTLPANDMPFKCGAVGYFAYDLGRQFEELPSIANNDIQIPEMAVGIYSQAVIYDNIEQTFYLLCKSDKRKELEREINQHLNQPHFEVASNANGFKLTTDWSSNMSKANYINKFNQVHEYLLSGDCYQINLTQRFTASYSGNEFDAYIALRKENNAPFSAFIRTDNSAILSVSPERFLLLKNKLVQSKPIKGTRPRYATQDADNQARLDLANSPKDKAENLMIVDLLRNDMSKVCLPGSVKVPKLFDIESFPAVHHLVSTVIGDIAPEYTATDLLRGAFPGGSITGAPKIRAMEIIEELEPHRRSVYCGSIGYISACGNMDTSITIRTLICDNNKVHCWAGGGLVADSNVDSEYQETFDKVNKILPILKAHFYDTSEH